MRYAISYWLTRDRISGSFDSACCSAASFASESSIARRSLRSMPAGLLTYSTGSSAARNSTPWWCDGRNPGPQIAASCGTPCGDAGVHHDEVRQVAVVGAERVADPRAGRRPARELEARVQELRRRVVIDVLGVHALYEAELVGDRAGVRQEVADPRAALAALLERPQAGPRSGTRIGRPTSSTAAASRVPRRAGPGRACARASACSRTCRRARSRRACAGRSRASRAPESGPRRARRRSSLRSRPALMRAAAEEIEQRQRAEARSPASAGSRGASGRVSNNRVSSWPCPQRTV